MMGMSVVTNDLVGASREDWFKFKGEELIDFMVDKRVEILQLFIEEIRKDKNYEKVIPKISIITTFYEGKEFLEGLLDNITQQTIFNN